MVQVSVKWNKQKLDGIDIDVSEPPSVFKAQLFALTGVPPERQKIMVKGGTLKDDADWTKLNIKDGHTFMMMGTAGENVPLAPVERTVFMEDLSDAEAASLVESFPAGLANLGNTCYMNATLQCFKAVPELRAALQRYTARITEGENEGKLTAAMRDLVTTLMHSAQPVPPMIFLNVLRTVFPQFAQKGENNVYMQQDAEECWSQILTTLGRKLPRLGSSEEPSPRHSAIEQIFNGEMVSSLKNVENPEEPETVTTTPFEKLQCHITGNTTFLIEGLKHGLQEHISKQSGTLQREAQYLKTSKITKLPYYLTIQFVRFFWKQDKQVKAKIVRPVEFPLTLDMYDLCDDAVKEKVAPKRRELLQAEELLSEATKKRKSTEGGKEEVKETKMDVEPTLDPASFVNETGMYELIAVLTHKGRMADSGHYVAWVKESNDKWLKYDDDVVSICNDEDIKKLSGKGGGDWHMAYMVLYRSKRVPQS